MKQIPYGRQSIFRKDLREVIKSLSNDLITTGPYVEKFEKLIKKAEDKINPKENAGHINALKQLEVLTKAGLGGV